MRTSAEIIHRRGAIRPLHDEYGMYYSTRAPMEMQGSWEIAAHSHSQWWTYESHQQPGNHQPDVIILPALDMQVIHARVCLSGIAPTKGQPNRLHRTCVTDNLFQGTNLSYKW